MFETRSLRIFSHYYPHILIFSKNYDENCRIPEISNCKWLKMYIWSGESLKWFQFQFLRFSLHDHYIYKTFLVAILTFTVIVNAFWSITVHFTYFCWRTNIITTRPCCITCSFTCWISERWKKTLSEAENHI